MYTVFPFGELYLEHLQLAFDCVAIACSLESIRLGLLQGCKAPNVVGYIGLLDNLFRERPTPLNMVCTTRTCDCTYRCCIIPTHRHVGGGYQHRL